MPYVRSMGGPSDCSPPIFEARLLAVIRSSDAHQPVNSRRRGPGVGSFARLAASSAKASNASRDRFEPATVAGRVDEGRQQARADLLNTVEDDSNIAQG